MRKIALISVLCAFIAGPVVADLNIAPPVGSLAIDFRTAAWGPAHGQTTYTVGNVTATALPQDTTLFRSEPEDGLGVQPGDQSDEIDYPEQLQIDIAGGMNLSGIWLADIFEAGDGGDGEEGTVKITLTDTTDTTLNFEGYWPLGTNNGELFVPFGASYNVSQLLFSSVDDFNDEYAVIGAVPVPGAVLLGMLGLSVVGVKLRKHA
jgi:hypothetical protein